MSSSLRIARRYVIYGRVQGVGFRYFTQNRAIACGVKGWVKNQHDGTVLVHAEGREIDLQQFETYLRMGPPGARVDQINTSQVQPQYKSSFEILS
jgi:acylphosphatase